MGYKWDRNAMRWIDKQQPFTHRTLPRQDLLRGLVEEIVYEGSQAKLYASLLANTICDGNPNARREFDDLMTKERNRVENEAA
jgi:hypothetical protein